MLKGLLNSLIMSLLCCDYAAMCDTCDSKNAKTPVGRACARERVNYRYFHTFVFTGLAGCLDGGLEFQTHTEGETFVSVVGVVSAYTTTTYSEVSVFFIGGLYGISNADEEIV